MRASAHVGRVGGLAVALGIGAAVVTGGAGSAWAAPAAATDSQTSADSAAPSGAPHAVRARGGRSAAPVARQGGGAGPGSTVNQSHPAPQLKLKPAMLPKSGMSTPQSARVQLPAVMTSRPVPVAATPATSGPVAAQAVTAPESAAAAAPVMVAASASASVDSVPSSLLGSGSGVPVDSPVAWVVLAAARRELDESKPVAAESVRVANRRATPQVEATPEVIPEATPDPATVTVTGTSSVPLTKITVGTPNPTTGVVTGSVTATSANRGRLTYSGSATTTEGKVTVNATTGAFTYTPTPAARHAAAQIGAATAAKTDTFTVTVTDGYGGKVPVMVTVVISPKNTAPIAGTTTVGTPNPSTGVVTGTVTGTDADKDTLAFSTPATTAKGAVTLDARTGAFTYTPASASRNVAGTDTFTVTITDGYGGSTPVSVSVPVVGTTQQSNLTFVFNYGSGSQYWTPEAKDSLASAAELLTAYFVVSTPVTIVFDVTAENSPDSWTLASAGSDLTNSNAGFFNTVVQQKILTGFDANGAEADGYVDVNLGIPWAYGDSVGADQYDFTSTAMHEMLHSMGFLSYLERPGSSWNARGTNWTTFDSFLVTNTKTRVIGTANNRNRWNTRYNTNLTGGNGGLFFGGPNAVLAYGGLVPLFTPAQWESGSSGSHLDDDTFTGAATQMMNAYADVGRGIRVLGAVELGILKDLGYTVVPIPGTASALLFVGFVFLRRRKR